MRNLLLLLPYLAIVPQRRHRREDSQEDILTACFLSSHESPYNLLYTSRNSPLLQVSHRFARTRPTHDIMAPGASRSRTLRLMVAHWFARSTHEARDSHIPATDEASNQGEHPLRSSYSTSSGYVYLLHLHIVSQIPCSISIYGAHLDIQH